MGRRKDKDKKASAYLQVHMTSEMYEWLKGEAEQEAVPMGALIRRVLSLYRKHLERNA